ncbi:hypothetical protein TNCV_2576161 [Trichonephila clavipes]|uniref:Uncharacterized protein n=1 Tax=Trichonephila clavipes TaxID=2585209 RepID=A0A8X6RA59_TRICX|nr:hypothetical protein TNCV_2576161 [Trichonephila clavipes]
MMLRVVVYHASSPQVQVHFSGWAMSTQPFVPTAKNPEGPELTKNGHQHDRQVAKVMPTWLYHQDFDKFEFNHHSSDAFKQLRCAGDFSLSDDDQCRDILHCIRRRLLRKRFKTASKEQNAGDEVRGAFRQRIPGTTLCSTLWQGIKSDITTSNQYSANLQWKHPEIYIGPRSKFSLNLKGDVDGIFRLEAIKTKGPDILLSDVIILYDNTMQHVAKVCVKALASKNRKFWNSPDLSPSEYHICGLVKKSRMG